MTLIDWLLLIVFLTLGPSAAGLLLWRRLEQRQYVNLQPGPRWLEDVPNGNEEAL